MSKQVMFLSKFPPTPEQVSVAKNDFDLEIICHGEYRPGFDGYIVQSVPEVMSVIQLAKSKDKQVTIGYFDNRKVFNQDGSYSYKVHDMRAWTLKTFPNGEKELVENV